MNIRALALLSFLALPSTALGGEASRSPRGTTAPDHEPPCDETEACFVAGMALSDEQQQRLHDIIEDAGKKQEALRDDTFHRLADLLTPEQARELEARRAALIGFRARRLRQQAQKMEQRARELRDRP